MSMCHRDTLDKRLSFINLKKKTAAIQLDKPVDDDLIRRTIERLDFKVVDIKTI